jgi:hypothetical protein
VLDEREVLAMQFSCCHSFVVGNDLVGHSATPTQWCRLKALHQQVTMGPCNLPPPPPTELENRALWYEALSEVASLFLHLLTPFSSFQA